MSYFPSIPERRNKLHNGNFPPYSNDKVQPLLRLAIEKVEECVEEQADFAVRVFILKMNNYVFSEGLINKVTLDLSQEFRKRMKKVHRDIRLNGLVKRLFQVCQNTKSVISLIFDMETLSLVYI